MTSFSKLLQTDPKKYPPKIKVVIFCAIMLSLNSFFIWFAIATFNRGSENLQDLTHVIGDLKGHRIIKHKYTSKHKTYYEDVLVIRIDSCDDEFGFTERNKFYDQLSNTVNRQSPPFFEMYYDKTRQRIEQNVTLHTFDMTINGEKYLSIDEIKKSEFTGSIISSIIALLLLAITYLGAKRILQQGIIV